MNAGLVVLAVVSSLLVSGLVLWRTIQRRPSPAFPRRRRRERLPGRTAPQPVPAAPPEGAPRNEAVLFFAESAELTPVARRVLAQAAERLTAHPGLSLTLEGSADSLGNPSRNLILARDRAAVVRRFFLDRGLAPDRLRSVVLLPRAGQTEEDRRRLRCVRLVWSVEPD